MWKHALIVSIRSKCFSVCVQLLGMLDMSVPVVAKFRRLLDSLPRETLPDVVASMIRTSNKEKLQVGPQVTGKLECGSLGKN